MTFPTDISLQNLGCRQHARNHATVQSRDDECQNDAANTASKNARPKNKRHQTINYVAQTDVKNVRTRKKPHHKTRDEVQNQERPQSHARIKIDNHRCQNQKRNAV